MNQTFAMLLLALGFMLLAIVCVGGFLMLSSALKKSHAKKHLSINLAVNNAIIDSYEQGVLRVKGQIRRGKTLISLQNPNKITNPFQREVLSLAFPAGVTEVTAKDFHFRVYDARKTVLWDSVKFMKTQDGLIDISTTPNQRFSSSKISATGKQLIPFLIMGSLDGSDWGGNTTYRSETGYNGAWDFGNSNGGTGTYNGGMIMLTTM